MRAAWLTGLRKNAPEFARCVDERVKVCYDQHGELMHRLLVFKFGVSHASEIEEAINDGFERLYEAWMDERAIEHPQRWVYRIACNKMFNRLKKTDVQRRDDGEFLRRQSDGTLTPEDILLDQRRRAALDDAIRSLTPLELGTLRARARGCSLAEIAAWPEFQGQDVKQDVKNVSKFIINIVKRLRAQI